MSKKLAIHGGKPVRKKPLFYSKHWVDEKDIKAVVKVLRSDWLTMGSSIQRFEKAVAEYAGAKHAIALSSGTAALHGCMFGLGIKPGDEVITSPMTFVASSNAVLYMGGRPVFADINPTTGNIDHDEIKRKISKRTKAIIPVHYAGLPCDMADIKKIANQYNLKIVEDAAHALGSQYKVGNKWFKVGTCAHSDMATFSFHPVKNITSGEGGMILLNDKKLEKKTRFIRMHGISTDIRRRLKKELIWLYEMTDLGLNYRITDIQCALGISQMGKLKKFIKLRNKIAERYQAAFKDMEEISLPNLSAFQKSVLKHAWHLYVIKLNFEKLRGTREDIYFALRAENIWPQVHYIPVHLHPYYKKKLGYKKGDFPIAEAFYERILSLPLYPKMNGQDVEDVINAVKKVIQYYKK
tara:strand:- start:9636 stop:10862 length:1227 start_codon:yes stop_codon:yes gene_type:complete